MMTETELKEVPLPKTQRIISPEIQMAQQQKNGLALRLTDMNGITELLFPSRHAVRQWAAEIKQAIDEAKR